MKRGETYQCTEAVEILHRLCPVFEIGDEFVHQSHAYVTTPMANVPMTLSVMPKSHALMMYSCCSSSMASSVKPSKSWLLIESISGAISDTQFFPALSARSESSWNRSMIFQIPRPG